MAFRPASARGLHRTTGEVFFRVSPNWKRQRNGEASRSRRTGERSLTAAEKFAAGRRAVKSKRRANAKGDVGIRRDWRGLRRQVRRGHAFRHKVFNVEIPEFSAADCRRSAGANVPHAAGSRAACRADKVNWYRPFAGFAHHRADHLAVRLNATSVSPAAPPAACRRYRATAH